MSVFNVSQLQPGVAQFFGQLERGMPLRQADNTESGKYVYTYWKNKPLSVGTHLNIFNKYPRGISEMLTRSCWV